MTPLAAASLAAAGVMDWGVTGWPVFCVFAVVLAVGSALWLCDWTTTDDGSQ